MERGAIVVVAGVDEGLVLLEELADGGGVVLVGVPEDGGGPADSRFLPLLVLGGASAALILRGGGASAAAHLRQHASDPKDRGANCFHCSVRSAFKNLPFFVGCRLVSHGRENWVLSEN